MRVFLSPCPDGSASNHRLSGDGLPGSDRDVTLESVIDGRIDVASRVSHSISSREAPQFSDDLLKDRSETIGVVFE